MLTNIPQATLSAIENDKINLGVERAKTLANALKCHSAALVFPGWEVSQPAYVVPRFSGQNSANRHVAS